MGYENPGDLGELLREIKSTRESIDRGEGKTAKRLDTVEASLNELYARHGRPGPEGEAFSPGLERKSAIQMCVHRHDLAVPKRDRGESDYEPSSTEIDEALSATKAFRLLLRHGDIERLDAMERKSLSSFAFGNVGWILPPQMSDRVLSCLTDHTNVASLMAQETISAGSVVFPLDNVELDAAWACEANCWPNLPHPDLSGIGQLEIKAEPIRALVCAGSDMLADASFNVEQWLTRKLARAFTNKISGAIIAGNGNGMPVGILNPQSGIPICDTGAGTPAGQVDWRDLVALKFQLPEQYQARGSYLMNGRTLGMCMTMSDASARPILLPVPISGDGRVGSGYAIAGSPVHIVSQMPDVAPGNVPIAFGDWEQTYLVVTRKATSLQPDPYSFGWCVGFKAEARIGGAPLCPGAARLLRIK